MLRRLAPFLADLWQHRELLWQFTLRNVELRHKGSHLGLVWSFLNPLLMLAVYMVVFGYINKGRFGVLPEETRTEFGLGVFFGLAIFHFASEVLASAAITITSNPNFVKKVVFPLEILPAAGVGAAAFHLLIGLGLALIGVLTLGPGLQPGALWLPVIVVPLVLLFLGASWFFSALGVFLRDIGPLMQFLTLVLMFCSGIFFSTRSIPPAVWSWLRFNPLLLGIEEARNAALWHLPVNPAHLAYLYIAGLGACYIGHGFFRRSKSAFADVL